ncbi:MAG: M4 family metallopeptidase [Dyadobacter sp.]|uniref:M4 family metallopeptidase n=1 Tax=Dyadobacter sp. TaxID=1914288 RepID=UPI001B1299F8|nr:M4 family metallopeptidase [Dyadobacter sp.]MBO9616836.1 M4 family metallopeptidase [Dyadobacter sp.]
MTDHGWLFLKDDPALHVSPDTFIVRYATNLGLSAGYKLKAIKEETDTPEGTMVVMRHQLFQLHYKNIPVEGNEFSLHSTENTLKTAHGRIVAGLDMDVAGGIDVAVALQTALDEQRLTQDNFDGDALPTGSLILARKDEHFLKESYRLAWVFDLKSERIQEPYRIYVDVRTGSILKKVPLFMNCFFASHDQTQQTQYPKAGLTPYKPWMVSTMLPNYNRYLNGQPHITFETEQTGAQYRLSAYNNTLNTRIATFTVLVNGQATFPWSWYPDVFNPTNNWSNADRNATTAHWLAQKMHDMCWLLFLRNGYDGNGKHPRVVVIEGNVPNAGWIGDQVQFGHFSNGSSMVTMDVFGHEYTHGVTATSAKLVYQGESGALNESISDIMGTTLEYHLLGVNANYSHGEDGQTTRDMSNPGLYGDPDTYLGPNWVPTNDPVDNGGVHHNSGVMNKWYWYMRTGGPTGTPLDYAKPAKVVYRALKFYLQSNSTYYDAAEATIQGAIDAYGACSDIARQAAYAWTQVGISQVTPCTDCNFTITTSASPAAPACGAPVTLAASCSGSGCSHINSFQWTGNGLVQSGKSVTINAPVAPGSYTYNVSTIKTGCLLNVVPLNLTTQNPCNFNVSASNSNGNPAPGQGLQLLYSCTGGDCGGVSYAWSGNGVNGSTSPLSINAPGAIGSYTYTVTATRNGCGSKTATTSINVSSGGALNACIESENANGNGPISSDPNASNGQTRGAENNNNHYVDYTVTGVPSSGVYIVKLRYYSSSAPVVSVSVNGGGGQTVNLAHSGSWNIVWTEQSFNVNLNAGTNTIKIQGIGGGSCRQDRICVTGGGGCNPPNPPSVNATPSTIDAGGSSTLSASNCNGTITWSNGLGNSGSVNVAPGATTTYYATCTVGGCTSSQAAVTVAVNGSPNFSQCKESELSAGTGAITSDPNASNGQTRGEENNGNHYVDYVITGVPAAGTYYMKLRYYSSVAPTVTVQVNGGNIQTVNLPHSGSWNIVWAEQTINVNLAAGNNTIRIQGAGGGSCRQDRICVNSNANARVSIGEQEAAPATGLFVSPNPNSGQFEVSFYLKRGEKTELSVVDMRGNVHFRQMLSGEGIHRQKVSMSNIPSGTYLVQLKGETGSTSTRTVILK